MAWEKFIQSGFRMPFYMQLFVEGYPAVARATGWHGAMWLVAIERQLNTVYFDPGMLVDYREHLKTKISIRAFQCHFITSLEDADRHLLFFCNTLFHYDYHDVSLPTCGRMLQKFVRLFREKFGLYGLPKLTDDALAPLLPHFLSVKLSDRELARYTRPVVMSEYTHERFALLSIVERIRAERLTKLFARSVKEIIDQLGRFHPALYYHIETYVRDYAWVPVTHHVQPMTLDQAFAAIAEALRDRTAMKELHHLRTVRVPRTKSMRSLFEERDRALLGFLQCLNQVNESRKAAMSKALLWSYPLFQAIADRLAVDIISLRQLTAKEVLQAVGAGRLSLRLRATMAERLETFVCLLSGGNIIHASGVRARGMIQRELGATEYTKLREVRGNVAERGHVKGKVRLILSEYHIERLKQGEILVTSMTDPDMVPAMKKAGAIVTDEGGITCHAAIVSRELGVPCIIGTKIATKVFKDGDRVEVDAERGIVRKL